MMKEKIKKDIQLFGKQLKWIEFSLKECQDIGIKENYTIDEFGKFETLCSRYARGIDFLIRKFFRNLDEYEFENQGTLIDVINSAHKRGLFESVDELRIMKDVRNTISHEYIEDELQEIFDEVLIYSQKLITIGQNSINYAKKLINN